MYKREIKVKGKKYFYYYHNIKEHGKVKNICLGSDLKKAKKKLKKLKKLSSSFFGFIKFPNKNLAFIFVILLLISGFIFYSGADVSTFNSLVAPIFSLTGFATVQDYTISSEEIICINLYDSSTYQNNITSLHDRTFFVHENITLCQDTYYTDTIHNFLIINDTNISLDCNESAIINNVSLGKAILSTYNNTEIKNCILQNFSLGINILDIDDASSPSEEWNWTQDQDVTYGESAQSIAIDQDGNYIAVGPDHSPGNNQWRVVKIDPNGTDIWNWTQDQSTSNENPQSVAVDQEGNYIVAGYDSSPGNNQLRLVKIDPNGTDTWNWTQDLSTGHDRAYSIAVDQEGNYIIAGYDNSPGNNQLRLVKIDPNGTDTWNWTQNPSTGIDQAWSVAVDQEGSYIVAGYEFVSGTNSQWRVVKIDPNGTDIWNWTQDPSTGTEYAYSIAVDQEGSYIVAGYDNSPGNNQLRLVKIDPNGTDIWNWTQDPSTSNDIALSVAVDQEGNYIVAGYDASPAGNSQWRVVKILPSKDHISSTISNISIYKQSTTTYLSINSTTDITNLTIGYNETAGTINFQNITINYGVLSYNKTILLDPEFVSLDTSWPYSSDFNQTANVTIYKNVSCSKVAYYRKTGFPRSRTEILQTGESFTPSSTSCSDTTNLVTFTVSDFDFAGYATTEGNNAPNNPAVTLSPLDGTANQDLTCTSTVNDSDTGDTLTANIIWMKGNTTEFEIDGLQATNNEDFTYVLTASGNLTAGDEWGCQVSIDDQTVNSSWVNATQFTVIASPAEGGKADQGGGHAKPSPPPTPPAPTPIPTPLPVEEEEVPPIEEAPVEVMPEYPRGGVEGWSKVIGIEDDIPILGDLYDMVDPPPEKVYTNVKLSAKEFGNGIKVEVEGQRIGYVEGQIRKLEEWALGLEKELQKLEKEKQELIKELEETVDKKKRKELQNKINELNKEIEEIKKSIKEKKEIKEVEGIEEDLAIYFVIDDKKPKFVVNFDEDYDQPSHCYNGIKDGDEERVDCGGSCAVDCLGIPYIVMNCEDGICTPGEECICVNECGKVKCFKLTFDLEWFLGWLLLLLLSVLGCFIIVPVRDLYWAFRRHYFDFDKMLHDIQIIKQLENINAMLDILEKQFSKRQFKEAMKTYTGLRRVYKVLPKEQKDYLYPRIIAVLAKRPKTSEEQRGIQMTKRLNTLVNEFKHNVNKREYEKALASYEQLKKEYQKLSPEEKTRIYPTIFPRIISELKKLPEMSGDKEKVSKEVNIIESIFQINKLIENFQNNIKKAKYQKSKEIYEQIRQAYNELPLKGKIKIYLKIRNALKQRRLE